MADYGYYGAIGNLGGGDTQPQERKYTIIQSLWTKPITDVSRLRDTLFMAALSLCYAHRSGYKVHMHTDSKGYDLMKNFGYEGLYETLDQIPASVPTELFAAGKFFAMKEEGICKVHIDVDVMLKKPVLDCFYEDNRIDLICQHEEPEEAFNHKNKIRNMFVLGYPAGTRPNWKGSINTGTIGFNNPVLAAKYMSNYFEALNMYSARQFNDYKQENGVSSEGMMFDFVLEQITLSYMSLGYNVHSLVPSDFAYATLVADKIGYTHLQGDGKWSASTRATIKRQLAEMDRKLYQTAMVAAARAK